MYTQVILTDQLATVYSGDVIRTGDDTQEILIHHLEIQAITGGK